jgi:hypothetical protein
MNSRRWVWIGTAVTVVAVAGLAGYFMVVGLEAADKVASVISGLAALVGLALAAYGLLTSSGGVRKGPKRRVAQRARASGRGQVTQVGGHQQADAEVPPPPRVDQWGKASGDGTITQVGGNQSPRE